MTEQEETKYLDEVWGSFPVRAMASTGFNVDRMMSKVEMIKAAYAFTVERQEEIRQLIEECSQMEDHFEMRMRDVETMIDEGDDGEGLVTYVRDLCEYTRILIRLQSILAEKKKGMKQ